jgi:hypothetical protein
MPSSTPKLGGAGHAQRQQQRHLDALLAAVEDARGHRRHRVAAQPQDHRQHRLAVQPHRAEGAVEHHGQPRQIARILQHAEGEKKRADNGQHDGKGVGQRHRKEAKLADQE